MIETTTKCDICKQPAPKGIAILCVRIDNKMHDLCDKCYGEIASLLEGTGREMPFDYSGLLQVQDNPYTSLIPRNPGVMGGGLQGIAVGISPNPNFQNADMASMPGGLQYVTYTDGSPVYDDTGMFTGVMMGDAQNTNINGGPGVIPPPSGFLGAPFDQLRERLSGGILSRFSSVKIEPV